MWIVIGIVVLLCVAFVLGAIFGQRLMKKAILEAEELSSSAEDFMERLKRKVGL